MEAGKENKAKNKECYFFYVQIYLQLTVSLQASLFENPKFLPLSLVASLSGQ